jgi:hypothetical protein
LNLIGTPFRTSTLFLKPRGSAMRWVGHTVAAGAGFSSREDENDAFGICGTRNLPDQILYVGIMDCGNGRIDAVKNGRPGFQNLSQP